MTQITVKILGVHFSYDKKLAAKENFCKPIIDGHTLLNVWNQCWLSLAGKIQSIKVDRVALTQFWNVLLVGSGIKLSMKSSFTSALYLR